MPQEIYCTALPSLATTMRFHQSPYISMLLIQSRCCT